MPTPSWPMAWNHWPTSSRRSSSPANSQIAAIPPRIIHLAMAKPNRSPPWWEPSPCWPPARASLSKAFTALLSPPATPPAIYTLVVLLGVIAIKEFMFRMIDRMGRRIGSEALRTEAWHHRSENAITSITALIGISVAIIGGPKYIAPTRGPRCWPA